MRGEVSRYDRLLGDGVIRGDDMADYTFTRDEVRDAAPPTVGARVSFTPDSTRARDVAALSTLSSPPPLGSGQGPGGQPPPLVLPDVSARGWGTGGDIGGPIDDSAGPGAWGYFVKCMRMYFNGNGRAMRAEYWSFQLFFYLFCIAGLAIDFGWNTAFGTMNSAPAYDEYGAYETSLGFLPIVTILVVLAMIIPGITVAIRRFHDVGMTGWLYLITLLSYLGSIFMFVVSLLPSQRYSNKHGPHPKASLASVFD
jgi:uncharacterized membrane protein YhaH (DUF805 family)